MPAAVSSISPRNKKMAAPPSAMPQPQHKRPSLRYSLNHLGKALADVVGKDARSATTHVRSASAIPMQSRRPSIAGAFEGEPHVRAPSASPSVPSAPAVAPIARRRSLVIKGALAAPSATPVPVGTAKISIRPKTATPTAIPARTPDDERQVEVKERRTDSPRGTHPAVGRAKEPDSRRPSPVRSPSGLPAPVAKGRASPARNDQTPKDDREKRRERREREKQAAEQRDREKREALERDKKEAQEREKKEAQERERARQAEAKKAQEAAQRAASSGHRTSSSTTTLTSASSIFTSVSRSNTADSHSSGGSTKVPAAKSQTAVFPRAAQTVILTPPDDEEEDEDLTIHTPMTRSRTATGSTSFGDISSPAISKSLLASISAQTESPIMAPLDHRLRRADSIVSLTSTLPSPVHPSTMAFPPPAKFSSKGAKDDEDSEDEGNVSALLETVISPLKGQATPAMPRFPSKSSARARKPDPSTPSRGGLPSREALSYASPAIPAPVQRTKGDKPGKSNALGQPQSRAPRESILSWDALVERSRLEEGEFEDMLRAPPPAVGLISPDMRPARNLPRLTGLGPKRMNLAGMSDSEAEIEEEAEDQTIHGSVNASQSISQVLFAPQAPVSPAKEKKSRKSQREMAEKEQVWAAKEEAWQREKAEWQVQRAQWEAERAQWGAQQNQWTTKWNAHQAEWNGQQTQWETQRAQWNAREQELTMAVQARDDDLEAMGHETSAHAAELEKRAEEHRLEVEALMKQAEAYRRQSQELRVVREKEVRFEAHARCTNALNSWTGVCAALKADAAACAADRAALKVILLGLEAMTRA